MKQSQKRKFQQIQKELLQKNRPAIPTDKVRFFEDVLKFKPYPYQAKFLEDPAPLKVLRWPRRAGKTTIMAGDDLYFAMHYANIKIIVTMPKYQQIKEIFFQAFHEHLARVSREIYDAYVESELQTIIRFTNGSIILAETPEPFTIRGHGPKKISID
jgi:phage FluMu gp28-like protein